MLSIVKNEIPKINSKIRKKFPRFLKMSKKNSQDFPGPGDAASPTPRGLHQAHYLKFSQYYYSPAGYWYCASMIHKYFDSIYT